MECDLTWKNLCMFQFCDTHFWANAITIAILISPTVFKVPTYWCVLMRLMNWRKSAINLLCMQWLGLAFRQSNIAIYWFNSMQFSSIRRRMKYTSTYICKHVWWLLFSSEWPNWMSFGIASKYKHPMQLPRSYLEEREGANLVKWQFRFDSVANEP